jgi:hypothetical protein
MPNRQPKLTMLSNPEAASTAANAADDEDDTSDAITQRVVAASTAAKPHTTAAASVFALGRQMEAKAAEPPAPPKAKKPPRAKPALVDLTAVEIKKGVPIPPVSRNVDTCKPTFWKLAQAMEVGDFVELPLRSGKTLVAKARARGLQMTTRLLPDGKMGIWRLS